MSRKWILRAVVLAGGFGGSSARFLVQEAADGNSFPWGTLLANVLGAFLLGFLTGRRRGRSELAAAGLGVGVIGAFTTFSALMGQISSMSLPAAVIYGSLSILLGLAAAVSGIRLARTSG